MRQKRKNSAGTKTVKIPLHTYNLIVKIGKKHELFNYEVIEKMTESYVKNFYPELGKYMSKGVEQCAR